MASVVGERAKMPAKGAISSENPREISPFGHVPR